MTNLMTMCRMNSEYKEMLLRDELISSQCPLLYALNFLISERYSVALNRMEVTSKNRHGKEFHSFGVTIDTTVEIKEATVESRVRDTLDVIEENIWNLAGVLNPIGFSQSYPHFIKDRHVCEKEEDFEVFRDLETGKPKEGFVYWSEEGTQGMFEFLNFKTVHYNLQKGHFELSSSELFQYHAYFSKFFELSAYQMEYSSNHVDAGNKSKLLYATTIELDKLKNAYQNFLILLFQRLFSLDKA